MVKVQTSEMDTLPALFSLLNNMLGLFSIVGFPWSHHTPSLVDFTMEIKVCTVLLRWVQYLHHSAVLNNGLGLLSIVGSDKALLA
jgi:hypothetical protein